MSEMKEIVLLLRGMSKPENRQNTVTYGEMSKLVTLLIHSLAPEKVQEAVQKLKQE